MGRTILFVLVNRAYEGEMTMGDTLDIPIVANVEPYKVFAIDEAA